MKTTATLSAAAAIALSLAGPPAVGAPTGTYQETAAKSCALDSQHGCNMDLPALPSTNALQVQAATCRITLYFLNLFTPPPDFVFISLSDLTNANPIFMEYFNNSSDVTGSNASGQVMGYWYYTAHVPAGSLSYIAAGQRPMVRIQLGTTFSYLTYANILCTVTGTLIPP